MRYRNVVIVVVIITNKVCVSLFRIGDNEHQRGYESSDLVTIGYFT